MSLRVGDVGAPAVKAQQMNIRIDPVELQKQLGSALEILATNAAEIERLRGHLDQDNREQIDTLLVQIASQARAVCKQFALPIDPLNDDSADMELPAIDRHSCGTCPHLTIGERAAVAELEQDVLPWPNALSLFRTALDRIDELAIIIDTTPPAEDGPHIVYVNEAVLRTTGYTSQEMIGQKPAMLQGPLTDRVTLERVRSALAEKRPVRGEIVNYTKDRKPYWLEFGIAPIAASDGNITHFIAIQRDVTARKAEEEQLGRERQLMAAGEKIGRVGSWTSNLAGEAMVWTQGLCDILDWDLEKPKPALDAFGMLFDEAWRPVVAQSFANCAEQGEPFSIEVSGVTAKGRSIWVALSGEPRLDEQGRITALVGAVHDITERKNKDIERDRYAHELEVVARDLSLAQKIAEIGRFNYSITHDLQFWSDELLQMTGLDRTRFPAPANFFIDTIDPEDKPEFLRLFQRAIDTGMPYQITVRVHRPDGKLMYMQIAAEVQETAESRNITGIARDVTMDRLRENALREQTERLQVISDATVDLIWEMDVASGTLWRSDGMKRLFGHEGLPSDPEMAHFAAFVHPDDRQRVEESFQAALASDGEQWNEEYRMHRHDGSIAIVEANASIIRKDDGTALRVIGSSKDVTAQRELAEQARRSQRLEAVGQLTGGVAHDFNNLLTVILGNTELLEEELGQDEHLREMAQLARLAAERGAELTSRLLAFARKQPLDPRPTDVDHLLEGMKPLLRRSLGEQLDIQMVLEGNDALASVDQAQLENAVLNLAINARDAMPEGGKLTIETSQVLLDAAYCEPYEDLKPGKYLLLAVSDTGTGMDEATIAKCIEPFFTTKPVGMGSGLGLSMVFGFVKQSQGHFRIYSEMGHGTSIKLYLPCANAGEHIVALSRREKQAIPRGTETILIVEDDDLVRSHAEVILGKLGYTIFSAPNGQEALAILTENPSIQLLFTDVVIPGGMNGRQLAEKALALMPQLKVLFTSGYTQNAIVHHGRLDEGIEFLAKPYRQEAVAVRLRAILDRPSDTE